MAAKEEAMTASALASLPPLELSRVTTLMLQAIGNDCSSQSDPESSNFQSLRFIFNSRPADLRTKEVIATLCNLLHTRAEKRHRPQESTQNKPIPVQALASSLLVSCLCGLRAWPLALIKLYITDALGARQWVQHVDCAELVQNIQTAWKELPNIEHEDKGEFQKELEQKQKQKRQHDRISEGISLAQTNQTSQEQQPPPKRGFVKEDSNSGSESSSGDEMEVDIGGGVALSGHQAMPALPRTTLVLGIPLEIDTSTQNIIQHPHVTPRVANRFSQLRTKAKDIILDATKARLVGLNTGGRDRESSGGGVATSTVWQVVLTLTEVASISEARVMAVSHLDKWLQSPALSRDALALKTAIIMALERYPGSAEEDIAVVRSVSCLHVKVSQLDSHVEHIASMAVMCPEFLREVILGVLLGVEGTRKDAGSNATAIDSRFQTKAMQAIQRAVGTDELLVFLGRICRDLSEEHVATAAASTNGTGNVDCMNSVALKYLSLGLSTIRRADDQPIHPIPLLHGLFYNSNRRAQIQGASSVATMGFIIAGMVRRVIMAHADAEVLHGSSKPSSSPPLMKMAEKYFSSHHVHHQQQYWAAATTISVPQKFISSLIPVIDCCSLWCSGDLRSLGASAKDCLTILQCMLFLSPSSEYKCGGGAFRDSVAVQYPTNPAQGSTTVGMANPAQHTDEHQDDMARILCERFGSVTGASIGAVLSLSEGLSPPPFEFVLSVIHKMVVRAAKSSAWLKTPVDYPDMNSPPEQPHQEEILQQVRSQSHKQSLSLQQQPKLRCRSPSLSEVVLEIQPSSSLGGKDGVPKDGFVQVDNPDLIKGIFSLSQWSCPPPSSLKTTPPYDIRSPVSCLEPGCDSTFVTWTLYQRHMSQSHGYPKLLNFAIRKLYWECCIICVILAAEKPQTIGIYMWNNDPTLRCLMQMLVCNQFESYPLCDVTTTSAYPCLHQQQDGSQLSSSREGDSDDSHVLHEDIIVSMEKITREWERREAQFKLDSAFPPSPPLTTQPRRVPSPKPLPTKQRRLQQKSKSTTTTTTHKSTTTPLVENISKRGRKRKSLFNLAALRDNDESSSELEVDVPVEGGKQQQKTKKGNKYIKKSMPEIICPEESPEDVEVRKFGLRISDIMLRESRGTMLGLPRFPPVEVLQMLRTTDGELGLGTRLRQSTQPDFITAVVQNIMPTTADSIERISCWLVPCMATEPNIIPRLPVQIVTHLALMACLQKKQEHEQTMKKRVVLYEEGFDLLIRGEHSKNSIFLDSIRLVSNDLAQHVSSFLWDASSPEVAAEAATVLLEAIGDVSASRRCAAHDLLNLACFSSSSGTCDGAFEVSEALATMSEGGEIESCWLTQLSKLPCFSAIKTVAASAFERALIQETDPAVLCGIIDAFGNADLCLIPYDRFCALFWLFLERGQVAEKVLLQHPSTLDLSSRVTRDSLINSYCINVEAADLNAPDGSYPVGNDAWKSYPLGRVFIRFPSSCCVKTMERGGAVVAGVEKKRKLKETEEETVLPSSVPLALLKVSMHLISMWQPRVEIPAIRDIFLMLLPTLEEDRTANVGIAGVSPCAGMGDEENGEDSSPIQLRDWINLARTRRHEVGRLTALCVPEPLLPRLLLGSGLGTGCILAALARLGNLGTHRLNALFHGPKVVSNLLLRIRAYLLKLKREEHEDEEVSSLISDQKTKNFLLYLESKADCPRKNQDKHVLRRKIVSLQLPAVTSLPFLSVLRDVPNATGNKVAESTPPLGWDGVLWKNLFVCNLSQFDKPQTSPDDECLGRLQSLISDSCNGSPAQACRSLLCLRRLALSAAASTISATRNRNTGVSFAENALRSVFLAVRHELEETEDRGAVTDTLGEFLAGGLTFVDDLLYLSEKSKAEAIPLMLVCNFLHWTLCEEWVKRFLKRSQMSFKHERNKLSLTALERTVMTSTNGTLNGRGESCKAMKWIRGVGSYLERKIHLSEAEITALGYIILNCAQFGDEEKITAKNVLVAYCVRVADAVAVLSRLFLTAAAIDGNGSGQEVYDKCKQEDTSRMLYAQQLLLVLYMQLPVEFSAPFKEPQPHLWNLLMKEFASYEHDLKESSCPHPGHRILSSTSILSTVSRDGAAGGSSSLSNALEDQQQSDGSAVFHTRLMCSIAKQYPLQVLSELKGVSHIIMDDTSFVKSNRALCPNMRPAIASGALGGSTTPFTKVHVRIWGSTYSGKLWVAVLDMLACCSRDAIKAAIANPQVFKDLMELIQVYLMLLSVQLEFGNAEETTACSLARGISEILQWIGQDDEADSLQVFGWPSANALLQEFVQDSSMAVVSSS